MQSMIPWDTDFGRSPTLPGDKNEEAVDLVAIDCQFRRRVFDHAGV